LVSPRELKKPIEEGQARTREVLVGTRRKLDKQDTDSDEGNKEQWEASQYRIPALQKGQLEEQKRE
jgi:hypothetical protein